MNHLAHLSHLVQDAICQEFGQEADPMVGRTQDPSFGDYQSNAAMSLAKRLGLKPREVAERLVGAIAWQEHFEAPSIAGPGFINFRLSEQTLSRLVSEVASDERGGVSPVAEPQTVVIDFSSPNVAKRLHVGHLRSTILGDAMQRTLRFLGHRVISDNHVGDWGTQYGLLIVAYRRWADPAALESDPVGHLESLYQRASALAKEDPAFAAEGRSELAKLHQGDAENLAIWRRFVTISREDVDRLYAMLDVRFDHWLGESFYNPQLAELVERLIAKGLAREDEGAILIYFDEEPGLADKPFLIRKQDGAFLYSTTDLATVEYRMREWNPQRILYFVDRRQALHFQQLFAAVRKMGIESVALEHIGFGTILNAEGKPLKTREGNTPSLRALLQEGIDAAERLVRENRPDFDQATIQRVSQAVGVGAIKYADLSQNRNTDYKFDLEKMISFEGDTGPYLQYTHARICSVLRKLEGEFTPPDTVVFAHPAELALARQLTRFEETLAKVAESCMPNFLCDSLLGLARSYSSFYTTCPILKAEGETRESRLALCLAVKRQLAAGLRCLGIEPLSEM